MKKSVIKLIIAIILFSFIGIKKDREWNEPSFFIKHRPTFTVEYYSITGESDTTAEDLKDFNDRKKELDYIEFAENSKDDFLDNLTVFLIPLMVVLLILSMLQFLKLIPINTTFKAFIISYICSLFLFFILFFIYWNFFSEGLLLIISYFVLTLITIYLMYKKNATKN